MNRKRDKLCNIWMENFIERVSWKTKRQMRKNTEIVLRKVDGGKIDSLGFCGQFFLSVVLNLPVLMPKYSLDS
jgi:hypothetical protein